MSITPVDRYPKGMQGKPVPVQMLGFNTLKLNAATIMAAVQMLLDATHREGCAPRVTEINTVRENTGVELIVTLEGGTK